MAGVANLDAGVTQQRKVPADLDKYIKNPGCPRANQVVDREHPEGEEPAPHDKTVLQQHVLFWDRDNDGKIYPWDTYVGFRRLGFNMLFSFFAIWFIHLSFSLQSQNTWLPDLRLPIVISNIHLCKHGSDSEVLDTEGRFVPEKFEEIFSKYSSTGDSMSFSELWAFTQATRNIVDPVGWSAMKFEWFTLYLLCRDPKTKRVSKDDMRRQYNGRLFYDIAERRENEQKERRAARAAGRDGKKASGPAAPTTSPTEINTGSKGESVTRPHRASKEE